MDARRRHLPWIAGWLVAGLVVCAALPGASRAHGEHGAALGSAPRNLQLTHVSSEHGLSQQIVMAIAQDRRGFLWFATQEGLNRYDGYEVTVYSHDATDGDTVSHDFVWDLFLDAAGVLWAVTNGGVNRYDDARDVFVREPFAELGVSGLGRYRLRAITQDATGAYWLGSEGGGLLRVSGAELTVYRHDPADERSLPNDTVLALLTDRSGVVWVGTDGGGLARFGPDDNGFDVFRRGEDPGSLSDDHVRALYEDHSGRLWVGTVTGGLNRLDRMRGRFQRFAHDPADPTSLSNDKVRSILEDSAGTLWVATDDGLNEWREPLRGFVRYRHDPTDRRSLPSDQLNALFQDRSGVLWIAGYAGVSRWNYFSDTFNYYREAEGFLAGDVVTSLAEDAAGNIWAGSYGAGLTRLDLASGRSEQFRHLPTDPASISDDRIMVVHVDSAGTLWAGTRGHGLLRLEAGGFRAYRHDSGDPGSLSGDGITSIHSDADGTLWVGVFDGGLNRMAPGADGRFTRYRHRPDDPRSLSTNRVLSVLRDSDGALWVTGEGGVLNRLDESSGGFERFELVPASGAAATGVIAWDLVEGDDGTLWIGTMSGGLARWDLSDRRAGRQRFHFYRKSNGLVSNTVNGIVPDGDGMLWLSTNRGLTRLDPATGAVRHFDRRNGLRDGEFNQGARLGARDGRILFGGSQGVVVFDPDTLPRNEHRPPVVVSASSRDRWLVRSGSGDPSPHVELGYLDPFVAFEFVGLDFVSPDKNRYRYRLSGFDHEWIEADRYRRAIYTHLPAGSYHFQVQAANNDNVWNRDGASIAVTVVPPPWQSRWAYLLYILLVLAGVIAYLRAQRQKLKREAEQRVRLEAEVAVRTRELADRNTDLEQANTKLAEASVTDSLTGLRNRRYVDQYIAAEVSLVERRMVEGHRAKLEGDKRDSARMMFFMMMDLDGFKTINDTYGHHAGDLALLEVKERLLGCCRLSDSVVRWGGDEFMVIGHATDFEGAKVLAERIRSSIAEPEYDVGGGSRGRLSASIGLAPYPFSRDRSNFLTWEQVTAVADRAAYVAKGNGRDLWVAVSGTELTAAGDFHRIATDMAGLVAEGKLAVATSSEAALDLPGASFTEPAASRR